MQNHQKNSRGNRGFRTPAPTSGTASDLARLARNADGKSYGAYKSLLGDWDYGDFCLHLDRIQADPFAPPSAVRIIAPALTLPKWAKHTGDARQAAADFLARRVAAKLGGDLSISSAGQEILERSAVLVTTAHVELRLQVRLPARGRTILGRKAAEIFETELPQAVRAALNVGDANALREHVESLEDHRALQALLEERGWVAFIADGSLLARHSGVSQEPLAGAVPFESPRSLRATVELPHAGQVSGMAIPRGITVLVGGGYHGKSTVLDALQRGVYPHQPKDGRELVATLPDAMKLRSADGRPVTNVDVSAFINHLPTGADTRHFSTRNASGSTSQAASLIEAVEAGSSLLLIDEDTSATNLMIRDTRMRALVPADQEPITPLVDRLRSLSDSGVSTILIMGGSGAYLDVADCVLQMNSYHCVDVTERARQVATRFPVPTGSQEEFPVPLVRIPRRLSGPDRPKTKSFGTSRVVLDREEIDLTDVEQVVDPGQAESIGWAVRGLVERMANSEQTLADLGDALEQKLNRDGLDALSGFGARRYPAFLVRPRRVDILAAANRYRRLEIA